MQSALEQLQGIKQLLQEMSSDSAFSGLNCRKVLTMVTEFTDHGLNVIARGNTRAVTDGAKEMLSFMNAHGNWFPLDMADQGRSQDLRSRLQQFAAS